MILIRRTFVALVLVAPWAWSAAETVSRTEESAKLDADKLAQHVKVLASEEFEGRGSDTEGDRLAIAYIEKQLRPIGRPPGGGESYRQSFQAKGKNLANVVVQLEGSDAKLRDEYVVLGAHHDHLGQRAGKTYFGADDNASGCAALIEIAKAMKEAGAPKRSILFVAFDGEEIGLLGSKHFVAHPPVPREKIVAMINLDMISRGEPDHVCLCGTSQSELLKQLVEAAAPAAELRLEYQYEKKWRDASDHGPFGDAKIPFLYFGVEDHADYHKPTDTADKIDATKLAKIARLACATVRAIADAPERPDFKAK